MDLPEDRTQVIPKVYKDSDQLNRALMFIKEKLAESKIDHDNRMQKWEEWDRAYRLIDKNRPDEGSRIVDQEIQVIIDTLVANEVEAFLAQDPPFEFMGMEDTDENQANIMTQYTADGLRRIQLREKFERSIRQKKIYGSCIVKTPFKSIVQERMVREVTERTPQPDGTFKVKTKDVKKKFPKFEDTDWEPVNIWDWYPVGRGKCIEELEGCIELHKRSYDELLAKEAKTVDGEQKGIYFGLDKVAPITDRKMTVAEYWGKIPMSVVTGDPEDRFEKFEGVISAVIDDSDDNGRDMRSQHAERTGETTHRPDDDDSGAVEGGIRFQENPFWDNERPYLFCPDKPVDNELYGIGIIEILFEKTQELNHTIRQIMDLKTLLLNAPTIEDRNAGIKREIKLVKNPRIQADDINGIKALPIPDFSVNGYQVIASIKDDMRRASAATEGVQGTPVKGEQSATEFAAIQQQAGVRIKNIIKLTDERLFKPFLERYYKHAQQFVEYDRIVKVVGREGVSFKPVKPEDIWGTFDIITKGPTEIESKVIMVNKLIQFLSIAARAPQFANLPFLLKEIYVGLGFPESKKNKVVTAGADESEEDIENEVVMLAMGNAVPAREGQNHQLHIQKKTEAFSQLMQSGQETPESTMAFKENIDTHFEMLQSGLTQGRVLGAQGGVPTQDPTQLESPNPLQEAEVDSTTGTSAV